MLFTDNGVDLDNPKSANLAHEDIITKTKANVATTFFSSNGDDTIIGGIHNDILNGHADNIPISLILAMVS